MTLPDLEERLGDLIARHEVPGASIAVLADGRVSTAAAGVLNLGTGVEATEDSLFQIGSITKLYTATLVMQLVEEGRVDLDAPVVTYLPELRLGDPEVTAAVTLRHLLTHTSGIAGDHFPDLGGGDDVVARYVADCAEIGQTQPLGATMSYCNAGFVIAGRVVERITGESWDDALAKRLLAPLGVGHTFTHPEDVLRFRSALGHAEDDEGRWRPVSQWGLPRSCGPAGLICATAADVVAFARLHLDGGRAADGRRVLSAESLAMMLEPRVAVPDPYTAGAEVGLAWFGFDGEGPRVHGHNGGTIGQASLMRIVPEAGVAVALLTNGGHVLDLFEDLVAPLLEELAEVRTAAPPAPPAVLPELDLASYVGAYERLGHRMEIERRDTGLVARMITTGPLAEVMPDPVVELDLVPVRAGLFVTRPAGVEAWSAMVFYRLEDGSPYVHFAVRATPTVGATARIDGPAPLDPPR
jgi:CubicO group peptidase (beta-lactamase class C family)